MGSRLTIAWIISLLAAFALCGCSGSQAPTGDQSVSKVFDEVDKDPGDGKPKERNTVPEPPPEGAGGNAAAGVNSMKKSGN